MVSTIVETDDGTGKIQENEITELRTTLYIQVSHKTADEIAVQYGFNNEELKLLHELLDRKNQPMWAMVLYGIQSGDSQIVEIALSQVGQVGGQPYWSWYGFNNRVSWCACFVSWCANECGYIENGIIPKFASCRNGVQWFKDRGQWLNGYEEPLPGMIVFFDWSSNGTQDGTPDHTGIVTKVENGIIHTVEGNSGNSCREKHYKVGHYEILGYGVPVY